MADFQINALDEWMSREGPCCEVAVSSRARLARNLPQDPFAPRANPAQLAHIAGRIGQAISRQQGRLNFRRLEMEELRACDRRLLRESHLISSELEKGGAGRAVYLNESMDTSVMVNEEDHLRLSTLSAGLRLQDTYARLAALEEELEGHLPMAYSEEFGYLTACPTNTGTGLRMSVMLHLPALALTRQIEATLADLGGYGLVVRGTYGENTEHMGDLFQISNEMTMGKSEPEILGILEQIVMQVIQRELEMRERLRGEWRGKLEDMVCRAIGLLGTARRIDSAEAAQLLSRTRLGIGEPWGTKISHSRLSRLFVQVQPAHLAKPGDLDDTPEERDEERAQMLRRIFDGQERNN